MATRRQSRVRAHWALLLLVGVPSRSARSPDLRYVFHMSYVFANFRNLPMDAVVVFLPVFYVTSDRHVASCRSRASFRRPGLGPDLMMFDVDVPMRKKNNRKPWNFVRRQGSHTYNDNLYIHIYDI